MLGICKDCGAEHHVAEESSLVFTENALSSPFTLLVSYPTKEEHTDALLSCFLFCRVWKSRLLFTETITSFFSDSNDATLLSEITASL